MNYIKTYCRLTDSACLVNGKLVATRDETSGDSWFKQLYKQLDIAYPKFYKMDLLSQAGFLSTEAIKRETEALRSAYADDEIGMVFANSSSSADTDLKFLKSYQDGGSPSPSLFVYTLPNIVLGELAISNKWYGENMFAVLPGFEPAFFLTHTRLMLATGCKAVLCGWVEILNGNTDVFVFFIEEKTGGICDYNQENLARLFAS